MNTQINVRIPDNLLSKAREYAQDYGFGTVQDLMKEALREKVFPEISEKELAMVTLLRKVSSEQNLYGSEEELFAKLRGKRSKK